MPVFKALILNKEINVNYEENQKVKLIEAINSINSKLESYGNQDGKISDTKLLSFLAIKLQAELLDLEEKTKIEKNFQNNNDEIGNNYKLYELREQNSQLRKENSLINEELLKIKNEIDLIIDLIKKTYEE